MRTPPRTSVRMRALVLLITALLFAGPRLYAQELPENYHQLNDDSASTGRCGSDMFHMTQMNVAMRGGPGNGTPIGSFPQNLIMTCGWFRLYFEDQAQTNGIGFDAPGALGLQRRTTACDVFTYISSIIQAPANNELIDIHFMLSVPLGGPLAQAGPFLDPVIMASGGISSGYAYDHIIQGIDPDVNEYDGTITVDFPSFNMPANPNVLLVGCDQYDLYSILLHEATHVLGWMSFIEPDGGGLPSSHWQNNGFGPLFSHYDMDYLWWGDIFAGGPYQKLLTVTQLIPFTYTLLNQANCLVDGRVWLRGTGAGNNDHPIRSSAGSPESGAYGYGSFMQWEPGSSLSHFDANEVTFGMRSHMAPGQRYEYVMGNGIHRRGIKHLQYSLPELRILQELGYTFDAGFMASTSLNGTDQNSWLLNTNTPPFTTNITGAQSNNGNGPWYWPDLNPPHFFTTNCAPVVIDLNSQPDLADNEGHSLSVMPGSLFNIRGCGNGGNNHAQLSLSPNNDVITFTPRPGFGGRAQFGFHLWDGHERGDFVYYTIFVTPDGCFTCPANNMVMEPGYEEGSEVTLSTNAATEALPNSSFVDGANGRFYCGRHLADGHPLTETSWFWTAGVGEYIRDSWKNCPSGTARESGYGYGMSQVNNTILPWLSPNTTTGDRYHRFAGNRNYSQLCSNMQNCHFYRLQFRANFDQSGVAGGSAWPFTANFLNDWTNATTNWLAPVNQFSAALNLTVPAPGSGWVNHVIDFWYCGNPANVMNLVPGGGGTVYIDDLQLQEIPPNVLTVNAGPDATTTCSQTCTQLNAVPSEQRCGFTYAWSPAAGLSSTSIPDPMACPTATTLYTVTVTDPCTGQVATDQVLVTVNTASCFTLTKTVNPTQTYSGAPVIFSITICNAGNTAQTVSLTETTIPNFIATSITPAWPNYPNTTNVLVPANGCTTVQVAGHFTAMGSYTNHVDMDPDINVSGDELSGEATVNVLQSCPLMVSGSGDCVNGPVNLCMGVHSLITDVHVIDFDWVYPDFLTPPNQAALLTSLTPPGGYSFDPAPGMCTIGTPAPYVGLAGYMIVHVHLTYLTPMSTAGIHQFFCMSFDLTGTPTPNVNQYLTMVIGSHGQHHTDLYDSMGNEIHPGTGFMTQAANIVLTGCPGMVTLDAGFTVDVPACGGAVTVHGNLNDPNAIHMWTWGDDRTTPMNGAQDYTYDYFAEITENTGWDFPGTIPAAPPGTYTITHTVILDGVATTYSQTITIYECCSASLVIADGTSSSNLPSTVSGTVDVQGQFIIDQDFTFMNADVKMEPGSEIIVHPGVLFDVDNSSMGSCQDVMWRGMTLMDGATAYVNGSFIDDAENAITALDGSVLWLANNQFHGNRVALYIPEMQGVWWNNVAMTMMNNMFYSSGPMAQPYPGQATTVGQVGFAAVHAYNTTVDFTGGGNMVFHLSNGLVGNRSNMKVSDCMFQNIQPDAAYAFQTGNGSGIYARGGHGFFSVDQTGYGTGGAASFNDCRWGIWTERMNLRSIQNRMVQVGVGYKAVNSSYMHIDILDNLIDAKYDGIDLFMNDGAAHLLVQDNDITFATNPPPGQFVKGYTAINVKEGNSANIGSMIKDNIIRYRAGATTARVGIGIISASNYFVVGNTLYMDNNAVNYAGILTSGCRKPTISCNDVHGSGTNYGVSLGQSAIRNNMGSKPVIYCNTLDATTNGLYFSGAAYGTDLSGNQLYRHKWGLHLDNSAIIEQQYFKGNLWYNNPIAGGLGAWYENPLSASFYRFRYDPALVGAGNPEPPSWDPPTWFNSYPGNNYRCYSHGLSYCAQFEREYCEECKTALDERIAENDLENDPYTEETKWMMKGDLYEKLQENPDMVQSDEQLAEFYDAMQNTSVAQFKQINEDYLKLFDLDETITTYLLQNRQAITDLMTQLKEAMAVLQNGGLTGGERTALLSTISGLQANIRDLTNLNKEALELAANSRVLSAESVKNINEGVGATQQIEDNEKQVNDIYLGTIAKDIDVFSDDQISLLYQIADQCPMVGGNAVYRARAMYALIDDSQEFDDPALCLEQGITVRHVVQTPVASGYGVEVVPNPATDEAVLLYHLGEGQRGTLVLEDAVGKRVARFNLSPEVERFGFSTAGLAPGSYHYLVLSDSGPVGQGQLTIIR